MYNFKVPVQNYVHALDRIDEMNVFLEVVFHQARHVKESKVFKFYWIDVVNVIIKKRLQDLHRIVRNVAPHNHFPKISEYFGL